MKTLVIALAVTLGAAQPAGAQQQPAAKEAPPAPAQPKDFKLPPRQEFTLANGMEVTLVPYGNIPKVNVQLVVRTGNVHEKQGEAWLADITADMLEEGTTSKTAEQVNAAAASMGGSIETIVTPDETVVAAETLAEFTPDVVALVADVVRNPRFGQEEFERIKQDRTRDLAIITSQPQALALEAFLKTVYPEHPYGQLFPSAETLAGFTLEQVKGFYTNNFGAQRSHLYVAGQFDAAKLRAAIEEAFADWAKGPEPKANVPQAKTRRAVHILDRPGSVQSTLYLGSPVPNPSDEHYVKLVVMNSLLGGFLGSRITSNIREQKGYTYSPRSSLSTRYRDAYWAQEADVTTNVTGASLKEIFGEIDRLQAEPPSDKELQTVKNYLVGTFIIQNSARQGIIGRLRFKDLHELPDSYLENYVQNILSVTAGDIQQMARKIQDDQMTVVIVGDKKAIEAQVKPFGNVVNIAPPK